VILSGDQLYRMDYRDLLTSHIESQADATIAGIPVTREAAKAFGIMRIDDDGRVQGFLEKPQTDKEADIVRMDPAWIDARGIDSQGRDLVASMGIYVFNRDTLLEVLEKTDYVDFGKEIFPASVRAKRVMLHLFDGYWEDIGTIKAFYEANLSLAQPNPPFDFSSPSAPIYTRPRFLPPTLMEDVSVKRSLIADGCRIGRGTTIENCVIGLRCIIGENVTLRNTVIMGADLYDDAKIRSQVSGAPQLGIGSGSYIDGAILDKNCRIGSNVRIVNEQQTEVQGEDEPCIIREGIPNVVKDAVLPDGFKL
jgi:glucose-1-phosphate adenylyltransferase